MSTRSFIAHKTESGIRGVYCHYDGYPEHVGRLLVQFHTTSHAVDNLIENGQIRSLEEDGTVDLFHEGDYEDYSCAADALSHGFDYCYVFTDNKWVAYARVKGEVIPVAIPSEEAAEESVVSAAEALDEAISTFIKASDAKFSSYAHAAGYLSGLMSRLAIDGHISAQGMDMATKQLTDWVAE